jgi:phage shock protein E
MMKFHRFRSLFSFQRRTKRVTPHHLREQLDQPNSPIVLDVRTSEECKRGHIAGALLIPVDELEQRLVDLAPHHGQSIVTV